MATKEYYREYRRTHPEAILRARLRSAVKLLQANGYTVWPPSFVNIDDSEEVNG